MWAHFFMGGFALKSALNICVSLKVATLSSYLSIIHMNTCTCMRVSVPVQSDGLHISFWDLHFSLSD